MKVMKTSAIQQNKRKTRKIMDKTTKTITLRRSLSQQGATNGILYLGYRQAGERAWLRLKQWLPQLVRHELADGCKDFAEMWVKGQWHS